MTAPSEPIGVDCPLKTGLKCSCTDRIKSESRCLFCNLNGVKELGVELGPNSSKDFVSGYYRELGDISQSPNSVLIVGGN
jgi:hypothetical protein